MKKKKTKEKRIYHKLTFWLGVLVLGTIVGISIQFSRAWVEPDNGPTDNNIAAPINTGATEQTKVGAEGKKADICVDPYGKGDKKCLGDLVTFPDCTLSGGVPITTDGMLTICKFPGTTCPTNVKISDTKTINWTQYLNYSETTPNTCTGTGSCASSVTTGFHPFGNIDPAVEILEKKDYYSGEKPWVLLRCPANTCTGQCWRGYWVCCGYYCSSSDEVWGWGECSSSPSTCVPTKAAVGCVIE